MISSLAKVKKKISSEGIIGLYISLMRRVGIIVSKQKFKLNARIFFLKYHRTFSANSFKHTIVDEFSMTQFPVQEILNKISTNKYLILSEEFKDFSKEPFPGILIWNKDLVNDVEWPLNKWGVDITIQTNKGDIKRPWELGRLHQLVQLGLCYRNLKNEVEKAEVFDLASKIFINFSESNIEFRGPQWMCAMDVGIRIANICLAADLFGKPFIQQHRDVLTFEVKRHEFFIENNLENKAWHFIGNHYLANLIGLIFCACHQTPDAKLIKKLYGQLMNEMDRQFSNDGGNFENSTYYHRLSGELVLFGLALCRQNLAECSLHVGLSEIQESKLNNILYFSESITDYEGYVPQIGDNDSGHLFIFDPIEFEKDDLNHARFISGLGIFLQQHNTEKLFSQVVKGFARKDTKSTQKIVDSKDVTHGDESRFLKMIGILPQIKNSQRYEFRLESDVIDQKDLIVFPDFGLFIYKTEKFFFGIRSGVSKADVIGGHRHVDQLSLALRSKHFSLPRDPGSFVYTSDIKTRNILRSAPVHRIPFALGDGVLRNENIFTLKDFNGECIYFGHNGFWGYYDGEFDRYYRLIQLGDNNIIIHDWSECGLPIFRLNFNEDVFSPHYGKLETF